MGEITPFAGLYQPAPGDDISSNGYQFYENIGVIDQMLQAAMTRRYDGEDAVLPFAEAPDLVVDSAGGLLPAGDTVYVGITAVDAYGGETTMVAASADIPGGLEDPVLPPALTAFNNGAGEMTAGTYRYGYTIVGDGGETELSEIAEVTILTDGVIRVTPPTSVTDSLEWRAYRSFGYSNFARVGGTVSGSAYIEDDGITHAIYYDQQPPEENTTGDTGSITITRPDLPTGATGWKVYAGLDSGLPSPSFVKEVDEADDVTGVIPAVVTTIELIDYTQIRAGSPPSVSRTVGGGSNVIAANVDYGGSGVVAQGGMASGTVEDSLDTLVGRTARMVNTVNSLYGNLTVSGSGTVGVAASGSAIVITGYSNAVSTTIEPLGGSAMTGEVSFVGASGVVVRQDMGASSIIIEGTTVRASGDVRLGGDVQLVGGTNISLTQDSAGSAITFDVSVPPSTTIREQGDVALDGDVQLVAGTGISISQDSAGSALTISTTGIAAASAGVNSVKLFGGSAKQGDLVLYAGSGMTLTTETDGFTFAMTDPMTEPTYLVNGAAGSAYTGSAHVYAGSGISISSEADGIAVHASASVRRFGHSFAVGGNISVAAGDTDFIPPFWVPVGPKSTVKLIGVRTKLNGSTGAQASGTVLQNGISIAGLDDIAIGTTASNDTPTVAPTLADMDMISFRIDAAGGSPKNLSATLVFEETILP